MRRLRLTDWAEMFEIEVRMSPHAKNASKGISAWKACSAHVSGAAHNALGPSLAVLSTLLALLAGGCKSLDCTANKRCTVLPEAAGSGGSAGTSGAGGSAGTGGDMGGSGGDAGSGAGGSDGGNAGSGAEGGSAGSATGGNGGAGAAGTGGDGGSAGDGGTPCDGSADPLEDACVISEKYGIFVSPRGSDTAGDGSRDKPYKNFSRGLLAAHAENKRLYACATLGKYNEALRIDAALDGVSVFGGLDCNDWHADVTLRATLHPTLGVALQIENLEKGVALKNLAFEANAATEVGESSMAALVLNSLSVEFEELTLKAGRGAHGANGTLDAYSWDGAAPKGNDALGWQPGAELSCPVCDAGDQALGGKGGDGNSDDPKPGADGAPALGDGKGGAQATATVDCTAGGDGADGVKPDDAESALSVGVVAYGRWLPKAGENGAPGGVGQGGGGGGGHYGLAGGGGGGCGGCGGAGGTAGGGGGASLGLLSINSSVALKNVAVTTDDAGEGGAGHEGQIESQEGGAEGSGADRGCPGGSGGRGAPGAAGGGGAGGVSIAILWWGTVDQEPAGEGLKLIVGNAGFGGPGGGANNGGMVGFAEEKVWANQL